MADFQQTIANTVSVFGPAPSDKWNAFNWGAFLWGEGTADLAVGFYKVLGETLTLSDALAKTQTRVIANDLSATSDMGSEQVSDGSGYYRLFPGGVTNGEDRVDSGWASGAAGSPTWTQSVASSTSWSGT